MKRILYLLRQSPGEFLKSLETLQSAVVSSIFEQKVSLLFRDEGVRQLIANPRGELAPAAAAETWQTTLAEADSYGITDIYACEGSLAIRKISVDDLLVPVQTLSEADQTALISSHDVVLSD